MQYRLTVSSTKKYTIVKPIEIAGVKINGRSISLLDRSCYVTAKWTGPPGEVQIEVQWVSRIDYFNNTAFAEMDSVNK